MYLKIAKLENVQTYELKKYELCCLLCVIYNFYGQFGYMYSYPYNITGSQYKKSMKNI